MYIPVRARCDMCSKIVKGDLTFAKHMQTDHGRGYPIACQTCAHVCSDIKNFDKHRRYLLFCLYQKYLGVI